MKKNNKKIIIVVPGGIGNAVMFIPAYESLKIQFPDSEFSLLTSNLGADKIFSRKNLKKIFIYKRSSKIDFIKLFFKILFFYNYDIFVAGMGINPFKAGILGLAAKAGTRLGENLFFRTHKIFSDITVHEVERNLKIIKPIISKENLNIIFPLDITENDCKEADALFAEYDIDFSADKYIGTHIGSNDFLAAKRWSKENFGILFDLINRYFPQYPILLFGGANESDYAKDLKTKARIINFTGKLNLHASAAAIEKCKLFITNDSGLMHIAAAVNTPIVALFGPTIKTKNSPYSQNSTVISKNYDCQPCYKYNKNISCNFDFKCMKDIKPEEVFETLKKYL